MNPLEILKINMEALDVVNEELKKRKLKFEEENSDLITRQKVLKESIKNNKELLTGIHREGFLLDGLKKREGGIGIRISKKYDIIYDEKEALKWAKEHNICLKLDNEAFENLAKTQDIMLNDKPIVEKTLTEEIKVTFPKVIKL